MTRLYSRLLQDTIVCVEDDQADSVREERVLYTRSEVVALQEAGPDAIRAVHELKKHFGGRYLGPVK